MRQLRRKYKHLDESDDSDNEASAKRTDSPQSQSRFQWAKLPLIYFAVALAASLCNALFFLMDHDSGFIVCGVLGLSVSLYGVKHFHTLMSLRVQIDTFEYNNHHFRAQRRDLSHEVDRLATANVELSDTRGRLERANEKTQELNEQLKLIAGHMKSFGKQSLAEIQAMEVKTNEIQNRWRDNLFRHERVMLTQVFERFEKQGSRLGMNRHEFDEFGKNLPPEYLLRFDRMVCVHALCTYHI